MFNLENQEIIYNVISILSLVLNTIQISNILFKTLNFEGLYNNIIPIIYYFMCVKSIKKILLNQRYDQIYSEIIK